MCDCEQVSGIVRVSVVLPSGHVLLTSVEVQSDDFVGLLRLSEKAYGKPLSTLVSSAGTILSPQFIGTLSDGDTLTAIAAPPPRIFSNAYSFTIVNGRDPPVMWGCDLSYGAVAVPVKEDLMSDDIETICVTKGAFAALTKSGSIATWGHSFLGGQLCQISAVKAVDFCQICATSSRFAALRKDGTVVKWGSTNYDNHIFQDNDSVFTQAFFRGGNEMGRVFSNRKLVNSWTNVSELFSNQHIFAALKRDGTFISEALPHSASSGLPNCMAQYIDLPSIQHTLPTDIKFVHGTHYAFAVCGNDGSVVTWGAAWAGGDSSAVRSQLDARIRIEKIVSNATAFAVLRENGSIIAWGNKVAGGDVGNSQDALDDGIVDIKATRRAFAALKAGGTIVTWGDARFGGTMSVRERDVSHWQSIYSNEFAFVALTSGGSVFTWGHRMHGGNSNAVKHQLQSGVQHIVATHFAFAALKDGGCVVTWGLSKGGGDSSLVRDQLASHIQALYSTRSAFLATKLDGGFVSWGNVYEGGNPLNGIDDEVSRNGEITHMDIGAKAGTCSICGDTFPSRNRMFAHVRDRHPETIGAKF